ncbi:glycosyltransferase family 39 protein [candidate division KSB1 bacterium]|nr:glycosyltransferase family 39 protein [candidate division KSB1 bacterium]
MMIFNYLHTIVHNQRKLLLLIFGLSLALRVIFVLSLEDKFYFSDSLAYEDCAVSILEGQGFGDFKRAPLYPLWMALVYFLAGGKSLLVLRIMDSVMGALLVLVIYFLGKEIYGRIAGAIAALIASLYPMFIFLAGLQYPTLLGTLMVTMGVYFAVLVFRKNQIYLSSLAGLFISIAALAIVPLGIVIIAAVFWLLFNTNLKFKHKIAHSCLMLAFIILPLITWTTRNYVHHGKFIPVREDAVRKMLMFEENRVNKRSMAGVQEKFMSMYKNPGTFSRHFKENFVNFFRLTPSLYLKSADPNYNAAIHEEDKRITKTNKFSQSQLSSLISAVTFGAILGLAILGLLCSGKDLRKSLLLLTAILALAITYSFYYGKIRYRIPVEPLMIVYAANGLKIALTYIGDRFKRRPYPFAMEN